MPKEKTDLDLWMKEALAAPGNGEPSLSVPHHVLFGEAVDIARFHKAYRPDIVREATSAYERRRRAEAKRRAKKADAPVPL